VEILVLFAVVVAVVTISMYLAGEWAGRLFSGGLVANLRAGETIVEENRVPDAWIARYRKKADDMRRAGKPNEDVNKVKQQARERCLKHMDKLILFFEKTNVTDSDETKEQLLWSLRQRRATWAGTSWEIFFAGAARPESPQASASESQDTATA
jgi:hypothetical protein